MIESWTLLSTVSFSSTPLDRLLPRGFPAGAARGGQSHHEGLQQHDCGGPLQANGSAALPLPLPSVHLRRLHPGHPEPAAPAASAQLHLHVSEYYPRCGPGEGEETKGEELRNRLCWF